MSAAETASAVVVVVVVMSMLVEFGDFSNKIFNLMVDKFKMIKFYIPACNAFVVVVDSVTFETEM